MSLYQCEQRGCVENTSCGWYHCRNVPDMVDEKFFGKALCCVCGPTHFLSGEKIKRMGKWHDRFERTFLPKGMFETNDDGNLCHKGTKSADYLKYALEHEEHEEIVKSKIEIKECPIDCCGCSCHICAPCRHCTDGHGMETI